ncbi:MAG: HAD-IA family hydrolase [Prolixibacteraceae bacterium]|jgi:HAD superfamily hydrolase (TIGR01509 family)|nr:HAD-IA family hydrolase [Prolixibacteraceae bacterium]
MTKIQELTVDPKAKGLIFDIDGTISDTMPIHLIAYQETAAEYGFEITSELFYSLSGIPAYQTSCLLKEKFKQDFDPQEFANKKEYHFLQNIYKAEPIKPVIKIIREYTGKLPMACGTGGTRFYATKTLELAGVLDHFEHIVTAEDVENHKPHPDTFLRAAELIGVEPEFCQVFEDSPLGIKAAEAAGMIATDILPFIKA